MRNYVQPGDSLAMAVPYAGGVTAGQGVLVGALFGVAAVDGAQSATIECQTTDEIEQSLPREVVLSSGCPRATARQRTGWEVRARSRSHHGRPSFAAPVGARRPRLVHPSVSRR